MHKNGKIILAILIIIATLVAGYFVCIKLLPQKVQAPTLSKTDSWKTSSNSEYGFELKYPADFFDENQQPKILVGDCDYNVFPEKCPNINNIVANDLALEGGNIVAIKNELLSSGYWDDSNGTKQVINNMNYCLYATGDAATGHAFNYYYFTTVKNKKCIVVYLSTSTTNCDFYLPLERGNTEQAKNYNDCLTTNKNQPTILNEIISTFKFIK